MTMRVWLVLVVIAALCGVAAGDKIPPAQMKKAKEAFNRASLLYEAARYDAAIAAYEEAYAAAPLPAFLFNLGQAHRLKGDKRKAVDYYQRYLALEPGGEGAVEAQSHLAVLGREVAAEDAAAREKAAAAERERAVEEARRKEREAARAEMEARPVAPPPADAAPAGGGRGLKIAGLATGGAGLVLTGVGIYFGLKASALSDDAEALTEWDPSVVDDGEAANRNLLIFVGVGAAAVVTGGVLYYLGMRADAAAERVSLAPLLLPEGGGVVVRAWFD
jgi:tetratricopeptide (TPR) repeat protein